MYARSSLLPVLVIACALTGCADQPPEEQAQYDHIPPRTGSNLPKAIPNPNYVNADDTQSYTAPPEGFYRAPPVTFIVPGSHH